MRSLESIFGDEIEYHRTVLFEDGEWCIYRRNNDRCYIIHRCVDVDKANDPGDVTCGACGEMVPVALKGLFMLNEWER